MLANDGGAQGFLDHGAQALAGMQQQQFGLRQAVDSGQLSIAPEAATNAAKACRDQKDRIDDKLVVLGRYFEQSGYGACGEGAQLQAKMATKFRQAHELLRKEQEILENMAQTYEAAGRHYQETEHAQADAFRGLH